MRQINAGLSIPEELTAIRSELQTGRLRWLHYLAEVTGLMSSAYALASHRPLRVHKILIEGGHTNENQGNYYD